MEANKEVVMLLRMYPVFLSSQQSPCVREDDRSRGLLGVSRESLERVPLL